MIDVGSACVALFSGIPEMCGFHGFEMSINPRASFELHFGVQPLSANNARSWKDYLLTRLLCNKLGSELSRLYESNTVSTSLMGVVVLLQRELVAAHWQSQPDSLTWRARAESDRNMLHAAAGDRTSVQLLLDDERQKRQSVARILTDLRRRVNHRSSLIASVRSTLHLNMC